MIYRKAIKPLVAHAMHLVLRYPSLSTRIHSLIARWPTLHQFLLGLYAETLNAAPENQRRRGISVERELADAHPRVRLIFYQLQAARNEKAGRS